MGMWCAWAHGLCPRAGTNPGEASKPLVCEYCLGRPAISRAAKPASARGAEVPRVLSSRRGLANPLLSRTALSALVAGATQCHTTSFLEGALDEKVATVDVAREAAHVATARLLAPIWVRVMPAFDRHYRFMPRREALTDSPSKQEPRLFSGAHPQKRQGTTVMTNLHPERGGRQISSPAIKGLIYIDL